MSIVHALFQGSPDWRIGPWLVAALLAACSAPEVAPLPDDLVLVRPYRGPVDACALAGESALTAEYLDDAVDLVACPTGGPDGASLVERSAARPVGTAGTYTLYSVPQR